MQEDDQVKFSIFSAKSRAGEGIVFIGCGFHLDNWEEKSLAFAEAFIVLRTTPIWQTEPTMQCRRIRTKSLKAQREEKETFLGEYLQRTWVEGQLAVHLHEWRKAESPSGPYPDPYVLAPMDGASSFAVRDFVSDAHLKAIEQSAECDDLRKFAKKCFEAPVITVDA